MNFVLEFATACIYIYICVCVYLYNYLYAPMHLRGVPQGSILGTLFFVLYLNDLPRVVYSAILYLFADDHY